MELIKIISVEKLKKFCNPFNGCCWKDLEYPLSKTEIKKQLLWNTIHPDDAYNKNSRQDHIERIAWFVINSWTKPIDIDVGVPSLGCYPKWLIQDGNHRFAAAIIRGDKTIEATMSGSINLIKEMFGE